MKRLLFHLTTCKQNALFQNTTLQQTGVWISEFRALIIEYNFAGIFFVFGTFMAGPAYHYWFNYLDELPATVYRLKQLKTRSK